MKKILFLCLSLFFASSALADTTHEHPKPAPENLKLIKELEGKWIGTHKNQAGEVGQVNLEYKVVSGGTAVEEKLFAGTEQEMVTMYTGAGNDKDLLMTHYCSLGNQPRMLMKNTDGKTLEFKFVDGVGIEGPSDGHMGALKMTLVDNTSLKQEWSFYEQGKVAHVSVFDFKRIQ